MFSVAIHGILKLNYVFELEDYLGALIYFKNLKDIHVKIVLVILEKNLVAFAMVLN